MSLMVIFKSFLLVFLFSCSSGKDLGSSPAESLYLQAKKLSESGRYILAVEKLNEIKSKYPYSFYAVPAELLNAEVLFKQENYIESAAAFLLFKDFHPQYKEIPYVIWMIAESYYKQMPKTFDRDISSSLEAIKYYQELIQRFPEYEKVNEAQSRLTEIQSFQRSKERYVADFYFKTKVYDAARFRYLDILRTFPYEEDPVLIEHSALRVIESSRNMKEWDDCLTYIEKFSPYIQNQEIISRMKFLKSRCVAKKV